ncbi:hypothetical protein N7527_007399 [Penicillium freii]|uniref:Uncharacterized protein n=1 Tax=Penicillium freii TaxID=48697 RepID=A0A101M7N8_PENFR|nr:hypothetical protein N7527_007399 [Penicillium freii]KUM55526.1 hypothetical protein ACN42_g11736 [Penicillium freii]
MKGYRTHIGYKSRLGLVLEGYRNPPVIRGEPLVSACQNVCNDNLNFQMSQIRQWKDTQDVILLSLFAIALSYPSFDRS